MQTEVELRIFDDGGQLAASHSILFGADVVIPVPSPQDIITIIMDGLQYQGSVYGRSLD